MRVIKVKSRIRDYKVIFGEFPSFFNTIIGKEEKRAYYVIDKKVWDLYRSTYFKRLKRENIVLIRADEFNKSLKTVTSLYDELIERSAKKNIVLVSIGGGIIQDVSGFLASTIYRGIKWIYVPTTLLAQADSCIGGKTSLNYKGYKNLIGTFYPPAEIFIDTQFISTQKDVDLYSGIGEIGKLHIMGGNKYLGSILKHLPEIISRRKEQLVDAIYNSLLIKRRYIEADEFDQGERNLLNFGHCFGHALETASGFKIPHGQAVVAGMMLSNIVAEKRGWLPVELEEKLFDKLLAPILSVKLHNYLLKEDKIISSMKKDKKRTGEKLPLITMGEGFKAVKVDDLDEEEIKLALNKLAARRPMV
jgi:3-dehydroquinate synthase